MLIVANVNHFQGKECGSMVQFCDRGRCSLKTPERNVFFFVLSGDCSRTHLLNSDDLRYSCNVNNCNYSENVKQFITYSSISLRLARSQIKLDVLTTD